MCQGCVSLSLSLSLSPGHHEQVSIRDHVSSAPLCPASSGGSRCLGVTSDGAQTQGIHVPSDTSHVSQRQIISAPICFSPLSSFSVGLDPIRGGGGHQFQDLLSCSRGQGDVSQNWSSKDVTKRFLDLSGKPPTLARDVFHTKSVNVLLRGNVAFQHSPGSCWPSCKTSF